MGQPETNIEEVREEFFCRRGWSRRKCLICAGEYYTKQGGDSCGSYDCVGKYSFLDIVSPKAYLELGMCAWRLRDFFINLGYRSHDPFAVVRKEERTLFASTAGQIYDDLIYHPAGESETQKCVVLQPVIRLQGMDLVASIDGISTSFIHTTTECWNVGTKDHFDTLDRWLDFLSSVGFYVGHLRLKVDREDNDWGGCVVTSEMIRMNYGGLEIGVANFFFNIPQLLESKATLSDVGVGLERLVWAVNKSPSYFDSVGPLSSIVLDKRRVLDAVRSATLIAGSGVIPSNSNHGSKLRAMIRIITEEVECLNLYELIRYYYNQWEAFMDLPVPQSDVYALIWREVNRGLNLEVSRALEINGPLGEDHETFLRRAVKNKVVSIKQVCETKRRKL